MIIWYNNSLLASIISIFGCVGIVAAVSELMKDEYIRELSVQEAICVIAAGVLMVILGKIISVSKAKKTQAKETRATASGSNAGYGQPRQTAAYAAQGTYAQPVQPVVGSAITGKSLNVPLVMAGIFFLLEPVMGIWANTLYTTSHYLTPALAVHDYADYCLLAEYIICVLLMIASLRGMRTQEISALHMIGLFGLAVTKAAAFCAARAMMEEEHVIYRGLNEMVLCGFAACLLMAVFVVLAMPQKRERFGGPVKYLWFLPSALLLVSNAYFFAYADVIRSIERMLQKNNFNGKPALVDGLAQVCLTLAIFFTGFCLQRVCRRKPAVYSTATAFNAQPAPAQPEPPRAAPVPPVQAEQPKQGNTAAGQAVNQDLEKKIQAYQDLLACGILSQEEYDQAIRELTRK